MPRLKTDNYRETYPVIGTISKGTPKKEYTKKDGTKGETVGGDTLGRLMRFESPYEEVRKAFLKNVNGAKEIKDEKNTYITFPQVTICFVFRDDDPLRELRANFKISNEWWDHTKKVYVQSCDGTRVYLENKDGFIRDCDRPCQKDCDCKPNGDLYFYVKELKPKKGESLPFGLVKTSRSSVYDVDLMKNTLSTYQQMFVGRTGYSIVGIPFILSKSERNIKAKDHARMTRWMIDIAVDPTWLNDQIADIENFEDIHKVFDYRAVGNSPGQVTDNDVDFPISNSIIKPYVVDSTPNEGGVKHISEVVPLPDFVVADENIMHKDEIKDPQKRQDQQPQIPGKVDPSPIKGYLERNGWLYNDSFVAKTGNVEQDTENLKQFFFGEVEQWLGIDEKQARKLLAEYYNNRVIVGHLSTQFEYGYHLLACTIDGAIAITNALTDNKYWVETKKGDSYKNFNHFEASYKKADPTSQPFPQNGDGHGWARVIDLLVARYEQEKSGDTKLKPIDFGTELYAIELPPNANTHTDPNAGRQDITNIEDIFSGW